YRVPALNGEYILTSVLHQGRQSTQRTFAGANGHSQILDARVHQSLLAARQSEEATTRDLAEALLQISAQLSAGDPTAHRALTQWLYHAGQVSRDVTTVAGVSGGNPLEALTIANLLDDVNRSVNESNAAVYECRFECI